MSHTSISNMNLNLLSRATQLNKDCECKVFKGDQGPPGKDCECKVIKGDQGPPGKDCDCKNVDLDYEFQIKI